jgi:hypothetical protein
MSPRWLAVLSLACVAGLWDEGHCPNTSGIEPGTYQSGGGRWNDGTGHYIGAQPGPKTMTIERTSTRDGIVRITYQRTGKTVVETWRAHEISGGWGTTQPCPPPDSISLDLLSFDFGEVPVGEARQAHFTYRNGGESVTGTPTVEVGGPDFTLDHNGCAALAPHSSCQIFVGFRPREPGRRSGYLRVSARPGGTVTAPRAGTGIVPDAAADGPPDASDVDAQPDTLDAAGSGAD